MSGRRRRRASFTRRVATSPTAGAATRSRPPCGGSRRWRRGGCRRRRCLQRSRRRLGSCSRSIARAWAATSATVRSRSSPAGAERSTSPRWAAGGSSAVRTSARSCTRPAGRWGLLGAASSGDQPLPADTEARLAQFTELLATAIANAESRAGLARLAEEQAALRRVATVVARGAPPAEVFGAVVEEIGPLLNVDSTIMGRYEAGHTVTFVGGWSRIHAL